MTINWDIKVLSAVASTQDIAHDAVRDGADEGYVVQAMKQTGARGRNGRVWEAPLGNIYMSLVLRPTCGLEHVGELAFVIAVGLSNALDDYIDQSKHKKTLKWPNDILVDGLKMSGILLETDMSNDNELEAVVVGIGLNIFQAPEFAVALSSVVKEPVYVTKVRDIVLEEISKAYRLWQEEGITPIRMKWLRNAHGLGEKMTAHLPNDKYEGVFEGLSEDGALILKEESGERRIINAGDVHFGQTEENA